MARATDTSPQVQLHPLVLLTISDYLTRHTLRRQNGPIVGAVMGQQTGREVTLEVAFEAKVVEKNGDWVLDAEWFQARVEDYRTVYKAPQLEIVGWYTMGSASGPEPHHMAIHEQINFYNESALILLFHPEAVLDGTATGGRLPITIYEVNPVGIRDENAMQEGEGGVPTSPVKFEELPYSVETGEAEMIGVNFIARGGGTATAVDAGKLQAKTSAASASNGKGKAKAEEKNATANGTALSSEASYLSREDDELISSLTTKANAIKMLRTRIGFLQSFLSSLPPSYLTDASISQPTVPPFTAPTSDPNVPNHQVLRSIQALLARLSLLTPTGQSDAFAQEQQEEKSDVQLVELLASITNSVADTKDLGRKWALVDGAKSSKMGKQRSGGSYLPLDGSDAESLLQANGKTSIQNLLNFTS